MKKLYLCHKTVVSAVGFESDCSASIFQGSWVSEAVDKHFQWIASSTHKLAEDNCIEVSNFQGRFAVLLRNVMVC